MQRFSLVLLLYAIFFYTEAGAQKDSIEIIPGKGFDNVVIGNTINTRLLKKNIGPFHESEPIFLCVYSPLKIFALRFKNIITKDENIEIVLRKSCFFDVYRVSAIIINSQAKCHIEHKIIPGKSTRLEISDYLNKIEYNNELKQFYKDRTKYILRNDTLIRIELM